MFKFFYPVVLLLLLTPYSQAQNYWQQKVDYTIDVTLNDINHTLKGTEKIKYTNNSPNKLDSIYFHLWPNAYRNTGSAYDLQKIRNGSTKFYFATKEDRGGYQNFNISTNNHNLEWSFVNGHEDIIVIVLPQTLVSKQSITFEISFTLDIPSSFSRLGHVNQSYQMTQWYPKPAVYDQYGWHMMPYLDQGEFYSEFGDFMVSITLPENYVVGATGELQELEEKKFLTQLNNETRQWAETYQLPLLKRKNNLLDDQKKDDIIPPSSEKTKTISFYANNVHDFAWFADKRFRYMEEKVQLSPGREITSFVMFSKTQENLWKDALKYVTRSLKFYSQHVGEYPYPKVGAVQSALSAGGGMEYPMITVIGTEDDARQLDRVITHEVGHNWFYGILGSNERTHPWMDEGLNSYYENRYMKTYYDGDGSLDIQSILPKFLVNGTGYNINQLAHQHQICNHRAQSPDLDSDDLSSANYGIMSYLKPVLAFNHLEAYIGTDKVDLAMQNYFDNWKFKHPNPQNLKSSFQSSLEMDLTWLFDDMMRSSKVMDYKLKSIQKNNKALYISIKNKGEINAPIPVYTLDFNNNYKLYTWLEGFQGEKVIESLNYHPAVKAIILDAQLQTLDSKHNNNIIRKSFLFDKALPPKLSLFGGLHNPKKYNIFFLPLFAFNNYDKSLLGFSLHNFRVPSSNTTWAISPMISTRDQSNSSSLGIFRGLAHVSHRFFIGESGKNGLRWISPGLDFQTFNYNYFEPSRFGLQYQKIQPSIKAHFEYQKQRITIDLNANTTYINRDVIDFTSESPIIQEKQNYYYNITAKLNKRTALHPYSYKFGLEFGERDLFKEVQYTIIRASANWAYTYNRGRHLRLRAFTGIMFSKLHDSNISGLLGLTGQGYTQYGDYQFNHWYFGRNDVEGLWSQQIFKENGNFKNAIPSPFATRGFNTNRFLFSLNIQVDLPKKIPLSSFIKPYFDIAYVALPNSELFAENSFNDKVWWSAGIELQLFDEIFEIYIPILNDAKIRSIYSEAFDGGSNNKKIFKRIAFMINLKRLNPQKLADVSTF